MRNFKIAACYCVFNEEDIIEYSIRSIYDSVDYIICVFGIYELFKNKVTTIDKSKIIIQGFPDPLHKIIICDSDGKTESEIRNSFVYICKQLKMDYCMIVDADEIHEPNKIEKLFNIVELNRDVDLFKVCWEIYWRSIYYKIEPITSTELICKVNNDLFFQFRNPIKTKKIMTVPISEYYFHHYSYSRPSERIKLKIHTGSCNYMMKKGPDWWFENVFLKWNENRNMENLHPYWPEVYKKAIRIKNEEVPEVMLQHPYSKLEVIP